MAEQSVEKRVLNSVARAGALTTRRVIKIYGPKPNWNSLLQERFLTEQFTDYGAILTLGPAARKQIADKNIKGLHYVGGPSAAADRAYLHDTIILLQSEGYGVDHFIFKRAGRVGAAARSQKATTDQIVSTVMIVPPDRLKYLEHKYLRPPRPGTRPEDEERPGRPRLYATISNGGIRLPRLKKLWETHRSHQYTWHAPLLIAVPDDTELRGYVRALEAEQQRIAERVSRGASPVEPVHLIRLIKVPLPEKTD